MDRTDWLLLNCLTTEKTFTAVAEKLFITQPALTYRIKVLEQELGCKLLIRTSKGVTLTGDGVITCKYAQEMLRKYDVLLNTLSSGSDVVRGSLNVAVSHAFMINSVPEMLCQFRKEYPEVTINLKSAMSSVCAHKLLHDDVQIAIVRGEHKLKCQADFLGSEEVLILCKEKIDLRKLPTLPYIKYVTDVTLERDIYNWWYENYDTPPMIVMQLDDSSACREMVVRGLGFTILPSLGKTLNAKYPFYQRTLVKPDGSKLIRTAWILYKEHTRQIKAAQIFIDFVKLYMTKVS